jgi:hypothetical protein
VKRLLLIAFFFEIGFVLIVMPWSAFWDRNYFAHAAPALGDIITNNFFRGAVSGLGVVNVIAGATDLIAMFLARSAEPPVSIKPSQLAGD